MTGKTGRNSSVFNDDTGGEGETEREREQLALCLNKYCIYLHTVSSCSNLNCYYCAGGGDHIL